MNCGDPHGARCNQPTSVFHIDAVSRGINVGKNRLKSIPAERVNGRAKGEAWDNDLAGTTLQRFPGQGQADIATGYTERFRVIECGSGTLFEQPAVLAEIREHPRVEQLLDDRRESF